MKMKTTLSSILILVLSTVLFGCNNRNNIKEDVRHKLSSVQEELINSGWVMMDEQIKNGEFPSTYGIKPIYGIQDNYFDIEIGLGENMAMKIIDLATDKCIRYVYVKEGTSTTISQIPKGKYYLKIAYGLDWMVLDTSEGLKGKFTRKTFYEKSLDVFDFGKKNSQNTINYSLKINIKDENIVNNFTTKTISEEEFYK